ncbi:MAG: acyl-CoA dehydrogenase, partial [Methylocystaceae bacterium]
MAATNYLWDVRETKFVVKEWLDMDKLLSMPTYSDYWTKEDIDTFIDVTQKIARDVLAPANEEGDNIGARFIDGQVVLPQGIMDSYKTVVEAELGPQGNDREAEGRLPRVFLSVLSEMLTGANPCMTPYWGLSGAAAEVIQHNGNEELKAKVLPKMFAGEWAGTMNLTEPGAGSEVGAALTKAYATDTPGYYRIKGQKCFITGGDHQMTENLIHLVLARIEGAKAGTAGISLFVVPKFRINDDGSVGESNDVLTAGIEHKMGIKGSATATLSFGENDNCYGWLVGNPPDETGKAEGMKQMFEMMNEARLGTGLLALACASEAYYNAREYCKTRIQGTKLTDPKGPRVRIIEHEDIRRMLLHQKACTEACRALIMKTYWYFDMSADATDPEEREHCENMFMINNPMCKAYPTEMGWPLIGEAIQCYGGYGFMEEYPVAQLARDVKIYSIWEGTTYIQSMDLVGRKFMMGKGKPFMKWMGELGAFIETNKNTEGFTAEFAMLGEAYAAFGGILGNFQTYLKEGKITMMPLFATRILQAMSMVYCGMLMLDQGLLAARKLAELGDAHYDANFYKGKIASAKFYVMNEVPLIFSIDKMIKA